MASLGRVADRVCGNTSNGDKLELIGKMRLCAFLSVAKEKYQKNRHVRKGPRSFPYGSYPLSGAPFCRGAKGPYALLLHMLTDVRNLGGAPSSRDRPVRGDVRKISSFFSAFQAISARTALRRSCGVSGVLDLPRCQPPSPIGGEGGGRSTEGFVREAVPPLRGALLVLFSRQGEKSTRIKLPDKPQFECYFFLVCFLGSGFLP